jgi:hypothetical protein
MTAPLKRPPELNVDRLRLFLEETIAGMTAESARIPIEPSNVGTFAEIGRTIAGLEALKNHLPQ